MSEQSGGSVICVTNRRLCPGDFAKRVKTIALAKPYAIILREKDLSPADYADLARSCLTICAEANVPLILHSHIQVARSLAVNGIHLPFPLFEREAETLADFRKIGVSVHSEAEAKVAAAKGATYLVAGHIFATDSKQGLPPRGLPFLENICHAVAIPVFAIGGMTPKHMPEITAAGAAGAAVMSSLMTGDDPAALLARFVTR